jgi:predicted alpha/beta superfamily hydrolase
MPVISRLLNMGIPTSGRRPALLALVLLAAACHSSAARPGAAMAVRTTAPDPVPARDGFTIDSRALGEPRPINVHLPSGYAASPAARFPVLYMPDGGMDEDFPHIVHTVDSLAALGAIRPVIIVGIPNTQRRRDLTGPTRIHSDSAIAPRVGGSADFRRFIRDELFPAIDARYRTTRERAIVGESLAGLFIVETFLVEPAMFDHYVAFDPSLWWNAGALADSAPSRLAALDSTPRTLFLASSADDVDGRSTRLAAAIRAAQPRGLAWRFTPRPDLTHGTIFRAVAPEGLREALR